MTSGLEKGFLTACLRWLAIVLIVRVLASILSYYPDYFPPRFDSLFLQGREHTFRGSYRIAFYAHILAGPVVLISGIVLLSKTIRSYATGLHRWLGRIHVAIVLLLLLPSGFMMSKQSFGGASAAWSFNLLTLATAFCTIAGVLAAKRGKYELHRRWMMRSYILICSAVLLRLMSGAADWIGVQDPEAAYIIAVWCSWLIPLLVHEMMILSHARHQSQPST